MAVPPDDPRAGSDAAVTAWPRYDVQRTSVRVVLLDPAGRLLLFDTVDPTMPETGSWWELPGGGMEAGESVAQTAVREIAEETGFALVPGDLQPPRWTRTATYLRRHVRTLQHEHVLVARVPTLAPEPVADGQTAAEREEYVGHRWWTAEDVVAGAAAGVRFFPGRLPELLAAFLDGAVIDEPLDVWN